MKFNVEIVVKPAPFYLEIVKKLQSITGVTVLSRPEQVKELLGVTA
ncbi:MAG: hypothetical protein QXP03_04740 [Desulfurococcaceae archaeon]